MSTVVIGDLHAPFTDIAALDRVLADVKAIKPKAVVQVGDALDMYCFSSHAKSLDGMSPLQELTEGRAMLESFWRSIQDAAPGAACYQLLGNHDERLRRKVMKVAPELEAILDFLDIGSLWRFDGVHTVEDYRETLELDGVVFHHGYGKSGSHMRKFLKPTVIGHLHLGGVEFMSLWNKTIYELNAGYLGSKDSMAFAYTPTKTANWTTGYALIDGLGPRFVPLEEPYNKTLGQQVQPNPAGGLKASLPPCHDKGAGCAARGRGAARVGSA